jgi:hypothetical protein
MLRFCGLFLLLLALTLGAAACGSSGSEPGTEPSQTTVAGTDSTQPTDSETTATEPSPTETTTPPTTAGGPPAPDFAGVTLDGAEVSLSEYRGKPLLLAFMASW